MKYLNEVTCCNCLDLLKDIPDECIDGVVSDPPFGESMGYDGDNSINEAEELIYSYLKLLEPKLKKNTHIAIFWTMRNLDVLIDAVRSCGFTYRRTLTMYIPKGGARPYLGWLPRTQAIVIAQKYLPRQPSEFHTELAQYLYDELEKSNFSRNSLAKALNCDSRLIMKWTRVNDPSWCLPTPRFYKPLKELLKLDDRYDILLNREPSNSTNNREDLAYKHDCYVVDNNNREMLHPSQKPLEVIKHLVTCVTKENETVFDGFGGSGTTALAAKLTNRNFIVSEINPEYVKKAKERLT